MGAVARETLGATEENMKGQAGQTGDSCRGPRQNRG